MNMKLLKVNQRTKVSIPGYKRSVVSLELKHLVSLRTVWL